MTGRIPLIHVCSFPVLAAVPIFRGKKLRTYPAIRAAFTTSLDPYIKHSKMTHHHLLSFPSEKSSLLLE